MSNVKIKIAKELLEKPIVRVAQAEPAAPAAPAPSSPAPAATPAQPVQPAQSQPSEDWVKLENIIKELQAYHSKQSQYGDRISIQVSDDPKSKKFTITIRKSDLVKPGNEGVQ